MPAMDLAAVMDELARRQKEREGGISRSYGWPNPVVSPPAFIVGYPAPINLDTSYGRGSDRGLFPCWAVFGNPHERTSRDTLSSFLAGIKASLDGPAEGIWQSARAQDITVETVSNDDGTEFLAARFNVDVLT